VFFFFFSVLEVYLGECTMLTQQLETTSDRCHATYTYIGLFAHFNLRQREQEEVTQHTSLNHQKKGEQ